MTQPSFGISSDRNGPTRVIAIEGEIDLTTAGRVNDLLEAAIRQEHGAVVVDLCEVPFIDSSGFKVLLSAMRRLDRQGRRLLLVCPPGPLLKLFEITRTVGTFEIHATRDAALAAG
jgi:anti-anti-sigma factor